MSITFAGDKTNPTTDKIKSYQDFVEIRNGDIGKDVEKLLKEIDLDNYDDSTISKLLELYDVLLDNPILSMFILKHVRYDLSSGFLPSIILRALYIEIQSNNFLYLSENIESVEKSISLLSEVAGLTDSDKEPILKQLSNIIINKIYCQFFLGEAISDEYKNTLQLLHQKGACEDTVMQVKLYVTNLLNISGNGPIDKDLDSYYSNAHGYDKNTYVLIKLRYGIESGSIVSIDDLNLIANQFEKINDDIQQNSELNYLKALYFYRKSNAKPILKTSNTIRGKIFSIIENIKNLIRKKEDSNNISSDDKEKDIETARKYCETSIEEVNKGENALLKVESLLLLARLSLNKNEKERFFYEAVESIVKHFGFDFHKYYKDLIIKSYRQEFLPEDTIISDDFLFFNCILPGYKNMINERERNEEKEMADFLKNDNFIRSPQSSLVEMFNKKFGYFRLFITSEENGETLLENNFNGQEKIFLDKLSDSVEGWQDIKLDIKDVLKDLNFTATMKGIIKTVGSKKYRIIIDKGDAQRTGFSDEQLRKVIDVSINKFIELTEDKQYKEYMDSYRRSLEPFVSSLKINEDPVLINLKSLGFNWISGAKMLLTELDEKFRNTKERLGSNYQLLKKLMVSKKFKGVVNEDFMNAFLIADEMTLGKYKDLNDLYNKIDLILGGKIKRKVLNLVKTFILSRYEMMKGGGIPFGLKGENIPLEGQIYAIIKTFTVLGASCKDNDNVLNVMRAWGREGYLNLDILNQMIPKLLEKPNKGENLKFYRNSKLSAKRKNFLEKRTCQIKALLSEIDALDKTKQEINKIQDGSSRSASNKSFDKIQVKIGMIAKLRKLIYVIRHGETPNDKPGGPPGSYDEVLCDEGILTSKWFGKIFKNLKLSFFSGEVPRVRQSSGIICKILNRCKKIIGDKLEDFESCLSCGQIKFSESLRNPDKNKATGRFISSLARMLKDDNVDELYEDIKNKIFSPLDESILFVSHKDTSRHLIGFLKNMISEEIKIDKMILKNREIYPFFMVGFDLMPYGLIFNLNWKVIILEINKIGRKIFGENTNILKILRKTELIEAQDLFFDFIDEKSESDPRNLKKFLDELKSNPITEHIYDLISKPEISE